MTTVYCDTAGTSTANCGLTVDLWMKPLLARLSGATESTVRCELGAAIREFYLQSRAWREQIGPYNVYANNDLVWLNPVDAYSYVVWVRGAWLQDGDRRDYLAASTFRDTRPTTGRPTAFSTPDPYVLRLHPVPDTAMGAVLWIDAALAPAVDASRFPNIAATHHFDAILEGALARLLVIPNKPWTDPVLGMRYSQTFRRRCMEWRSISEQGYSHADQGWRFPAFA